jgi:hypothetical protein
MFPFLMVASVILISVEFFFSRADKKNSDTLKKSTAMFFGAPIGYIPLALICQREFGNIWQPFVAQAQWGRKLGLHWDLILNPRVINGSNEVLVWDLIGFYCPLVLFSWTMFQIITNKSQLDKNLLRASLLASLIGCAHSAAAFLTYDRFMSIGRHVLANPLPFMGILVALQTVPSKNEVLTTKMLKFVIFASVVFLGMWWVRFSRDQWIG